MGGGIVRIERNGLVVARKRLLGSFQCLEHGTPLIVRGRHMRRDREGEIDLRNGSAWVAAPVVDDPEQVQTVEMPGMVFRKWAIGAPNPSLRPVPMQAARHSVEKPGEAQVAAAKLIEVGAVDRTSKLAFAQLHEAANVRIAGATNWDTREQFQEPPRGLPECL